MYSIAIGTGARNGILVQTPQNKTAFWHKSLHLIPHLTEKRTNILQYLSQKAHHIDG